MHLDPLLPKLVGFAFVVLVVALLLRLLKQPHVVAYLIAGVIIGPFGLGLIEERETLTRMGEFGVVLLLFFVGMEISLPRLIAGWRIAIIGTLFQIAVSVGFVGAIGSYFDWPLARIVLLGFVISLSSTAVLFKVLQDWGEMDTNVGQNVIGILLVQDVAIVPMLIILRSLGGEETSTGELLRQGIGGLCIIALMAWILIRGQIHLPFSRLIGDDHELQIFAAMILCFGLAELTGLAGLSTALGAFVAGIVISAARETHWVHESLDSFRVVFIALFFVAIGMLIDLDFLLEHWQMVGLLVATVLLTNTFINAVILRVLGETWRESFYAGALLSQIGEFSFVLGAVGLQSGIINDFAYQATVATIALTLFLSPMWIHLMKKATRHVAPKPAPAVTQPH